jgi:hypothetical protein
MTDSRAGLAIPNRERERMTKMNLKGEERQEINNTIDEEVRAFLRHNCVAYQQ